jgi:protein SCO1
MTSKTTTLIIGCVALITAALGFWLAREIDRSAPQLASGTWLPQPRELGGFTLTDQNGLPFGADRLRGAPSLVYFGFTHCPDVCPVTLLQLAQVRRAGVIPGLRVLFISVDPARDTPPILAQYVHAFDPDFIGLTGSEAMLDRLAHRLGIAFLRVNLPGGDYTMDHSATVFLLDRRGRNVAVFTPPYDVPRLLTDLRRAAGSLG